MEALWLLDALWKVTALFALGAAGACALRRSSARTRYFLWAGVLASAALLPGLGAWIPRVRVPLWTWTAPVAHVEHVAAGSAAPELAGATLAPVPRGDDRPTAPRGAFAPSPAALVAALWFGGLALALARLALGVRRARALARGARDLDGPSWRALVAELRPRLPGLRDVRVCASPDIASPATFGVLRPVVLLPAEATAWSAERRRVVLLHELVHVARRDWVVQLVAQLVRAVYWFHPLAHFAARRLAWERERACDERVIALGAAPSDYASHLLAVALALPQRSPLSAALAMAPPSKRAQLEGRLMSILEAKPATRASRSLARVLVPVLVLSVPALASIQPWATTAEPHECACHADSPSQGPTERARELERERARLVESEQAIAELHAALRSAEEKLAAQQAHVHELKARLEALHGTGANPDRHRAQERQELERLHAMRAAEQRIERMNREKAQRDAERELVRRKIELQRQLHESEGALEGRDDRARELYLREIDLKHRAQELHRHAQELRRLEGANVERDAKRALEEALRAREAGEAAHDEYRHLREHDGARRAYEEALKAREKALYHQEHGQKQEHEHELDAVRELYVDARGVELERKAQVETARRLQRELDDAQAAVDPTVEASQDAIEDLLLELRSARRDRPDGADRSDSSSAASGTH